MVNLVPAALFLLFLCTGQVCAGSCDRASFGGFRQVDLMDTRGRVLVEQADGALTVRTVASGKQLVVSGTWVDPYSGEILRGVPAAEIEIDHVVPVCWAWEHGAENWSFEQRRAFYNDRRYLLAVRADLNASKGDNGPDVFMPLQKSFACTYVELFFQALATYDLEVEGDEALSLKNTRDLACRDKLTN